MAEPGEYSSDEKLRWEIEKLRAEVSHLKRPWLRQPASWLAVATILLTLVGSILQASRSSREYQLAEIKRERANLDIEKADRTYQQYQGQIAQARAQIAQAERQLSDLHAVYAKEANKLGELHAEIEKLPAAVATRALKEKSTESVRELQAAQATLSTRTTKTVTALQRIESFLAGIGSSNDLLVEVEVSTIDASSGKIIHGFEVLAAPLGMTDRAFTFQELSSPTSAQLYRGIYLVWARRRTSAGIVESPKIRISLIEGGHQALVLPVPREFQGDTK